MEKTVAISLLGTTLDKRGKNAERWEHWRPTISMCQHDDMVIDRLELIYGSHYKELADFVREDLRIVSPETKVNLHELEFSDPWDFESVYGLLMDFARKYPFQLDKERYLIHITTGTHVCQICLYLLTEARYLPGQLIQTSPGSRRHPTDSRYQIIDLDLSKYDQIASRFQIEKEEGRVYLKGGIQTRNKRFNTMIEQLEHVSIKSSEPILLTGPTGAGKSQLATRIFALRQQRRQVEGSLVQVNCATLRGENAMSALFGHKKGAFTGANNARPGLLKEAHKGLLFLDEIGELGIDEQAMLLRAIEDKRFIPLGADKEEHSDFQLISGTNRDLYKAVQQGKFREDLLARINLWTYQLPSLKERIEDLEPNIEFELENWAQKQKQLISFNKNARQQYLLFASSEKAIWAANFRDLNASIKRMATLAPGGRINEATVQDEIARLQQHWHTYQQSPVLASTQLCERVLDTEVLSKLDVFDRLQLESVLKACNTSQSMAEAGRYLFDKSRLQRKAVNDSQRLRLYLEKFGLKFQTIKRLLQTHSSNIKED